MGVCVYVCMCVFLFILRVCRKREYHCEKFWWPMIGHQNFKPFLVYVCMCVCV
jgi:hypothetical protein